MNLTKAIERAFDELWPNLYTIVPGLGQGDAKRQVKSFLASQIEKAVEEERRRILGILPKKIRKHKTNGIRGWDYPDYELPEGCEVDAFATGLNYVVKIIKKELSSLKGSDQLLKTKEDL